MAFGGSGSVFSSVESKQDLAKELRGHQVAIAELSSLSSSRSVYQRKGTIFFKTTIQKATAAEQKEFDLIKENLERQQGAA